MERREQLMRCSVKLLLILSVFTAVFTSTHAKVILTATDGAVSVPEGYDVVLLNNSLTLKCHATMFPSVTSLLWNITLNDSTSVRGSSGTLSSIGQGKYSLPDGLQTENPTLLNIHNLQLHENGFTVQCGVLNLSGVYVAISQAKVVFVEGAPLCPKVNIDGTVNCTITWSHDNYALLPVNYTISVRTLSGETVAEFPQNTTQTHYELSLAKWCFPAPTNYTVTVVACNKAGCSQNCNRTSVFFPPKVSSPGTDTQGTAGTSSVPHRNAGIVAAVVTCISVGIGIMIVVVIISWCLVWKWKSKKDKHSINEIVPEQTSKNDYVLEEYATVTDVVKNHHLHTPPDKSIPTSCSHHSNVTDTEGYGTVQNAAKSPQKVFKEGSFKTKPSVPITSEYALVNHNTNNQTSTHVRPTTHSTRHSITGPIAVPSEYAQVPDSIKMKSPLQRTQSIPTPSSIADATFLPAPPPLPPRGSELLSESPDVIDAGYASLPHKNTSGKITKVRPSKRGSSRDVQV